MQISLGAKLRSTYSYIKNMGACGSAVRPQVNPIASKPQPESTAVIVKSPYVNNAPLVPLQSLWSFLNERIQQVAMREDKEWLRDVWTGDTLRYSELEPLSRSVTTGLHKRGFSPGDTLIFTTSNCTFLYVVAMSVWRLNGILRASYPEDSADTLLVRLIESEAKFILCDKDTASRALMATQGAHWEVHVFAMGEVDGCTPLEELLQDDCDSFPGDAEVNPESDPIYVPTTSGTIGISKGPVHTHFSFISCLIQGMLLPEQSNGRHLLCSRCHHFAGFLAPLLALLRGEQILTMTQFDARAALQAIQDHGPSSVIGLLPALLQMAREPIRQKQDHSGVLTMVTGGSLISPEDEDELLNSFQSLKAVYIYYGMAECFLTTSTIPFYTIDQWTIPEKPRGTVGLLLPYTEARVVSLEDGYPLGPNERGEICIRSPTLMPGYWRRPDVTTKTIHGNWLCSGDYGYFDSNGFFFVTDRIKEVFVHWGRYISPSEMEKIISQHPGVQEVAVIGIPDPAAGSQARAYVVMRPNASGTVTSKALQDLVAQASSQRLQLGAGVVFVDELQRDKMGRINKQELRAIAEEESMAQTAYAADPEKRN